MEKLELPGLDRLLAVCHRLGLRQVTPPPGHHPPEPFAPVEGAPLDPMLASFYSRMGRAILADDADGIVMLRVDDSANELASETRALRDTWPEGIFASVLIFAGRPHLAHHYATVPALADARGCQPVVRIDAYEQPYALPIASTVDRFFDTYSRYLEELVVHEDFQDSGSAALSFPWKVPHLLARDERLVQLIREGRFASLMADGDASVHAWAAELVAAPRRS